MPGLNGNRDRIESHDTREITIVVWNENNLVQMSDSSDQRGLSAVNERIETTAGQITQIDEERRRMDLVEGMLQVLTEAPLLQLQHPCLLLLPLSIQSVPP